LNIGQASMGLALGSIRLSLSCIVRQRHSFQPVFLDVPKCGAAFYSPLFRKLQASNQSRSRQPATATIRLAGGIIQHARIALHRCLRRGNRASLQPAPK
jgi:hypothetical protein